MSKVYSFRLSNDNPREAQAREVIESCVAEGYSLRHVVVEALLSTKQEGREHDNLNSIVGQLHDLILSLDNREHTSGSDLSSSFLNAMRQAVRDGIRVELNPKI